MTFVLLKLGLFLWLINVGKSYYHTNSYIGINNLNQKKMLTRSSKLILWDQNNLLDFEVIANNFKIIAFGQKPNQNYGLEPKDRKYFIMNKSIEVSKINGIGLDLVEVSNKADGVSGLVLIYEIIPGSNAEKTGSFLPGDALTRISTKDKAIDVTGLNYDQTLNAIGKFEGSETLSITIQRLQLRKEIKVKVVGPQGEYVTEFNTFSGYGSNLRTALQSNNLKMYDDRTGRFDSPYQTGNCGGEGTCGTCIISVIEGIVL